VTTLTNLPAITSNWLTAAGLATDAVNEIVDQVWDEVLSGHLTAGTTGAGLNAAGSAGDPWGTAVPGAYSAGSAGYILGTNLNATVSSRASQTSVDTVDDLLDTEIAAIKADTAAILTDTGTTLDGKIDTIDTVVDAIKAKTDSLTFTVAGKVDSNTLAINGSTVAAQMQAKGAKAIATAVVGVGSSTTSIVLASITNATGALTVGDADQLKGRVFLFDDDTTTTQLQSQGTDITANTTGATPTLTVTALTRAPAAGDAMTIF